MSLYEIISTSFSIILIIIAIIQCSQNKKLKKENTKLIQQVSIKQVNQDNNSSVQTIRDNKIKQKHTGIGNNINAGRDIKS